MGIVRGGTYIESIIKLPPPYERMKIIHPPSSTAGATAPAVLYVLIMGHMLRAMHVCVRIDNQSIQLSAVCAGGA